MRTFLIALLLVSAPLATTLLIPAASAGCVTGSSNPNGTTTVIFTLGAAGRPDIGVWLENNCYPFTAHDGSQDQGTVTATYDARNEPARCEYVPRVEVFILGVVPGTDQTHCTSSTQVYESRSFSYGPVADIGLLACTTGANACIWITPRYLVFVCLAMSPGPVSVNPVPGTSATTASLTCTVS